MSLNKLYMTATKIWVWSEEVVFVTLPLSGASPLPNVLVINISNDSFLSIFVSYLSILQTWEQKTRAFYYIIMLCAQNNAVQTFTVVV